MKSSRDHMIHGEECGYFDVGLQIVVGWLNVTRTFKKSHGESDNFYLVKNYQYIFFPFIQSTDFCESIHRQGFSLSTLKDVHSVLV